MTIFFGFIIFLFGLIVGSFLNCLIYRLEINALFQVFFKKGQGFSRSYCPACKHKLSWQDLIPVLSFLILKGNCRYCRKKISLQYPIVEIATGLLFLFIFSSQTLPIAIYCLVIACFLIVIFVYDLKHYIIPDEIIFSGIAVAVIYNISQLLISGHQLVISNFLSAAGAAGFFLAIVLWSKGKWMGIGDIKVAFLMGLFLGWPNILVALFSAFFIGAIIGVALIISRRKKLKSEVPFGPFLVTGTFLALFFGENIVNWYTGLLLI